jgi:hypothetical protein
MDKAVEGRLLGDQFLEKLLDMISQVMTTE